MLLLPCPRLIALSFLLLLALTLSLLIFRGPSSIQEATNPLYDLKIQRGIKIPQEFVDQYLSPLQIQDETALWLTQGDSVGQLSSEPGPHPYLQPLLQCHKKPNPHTRHIRLSAIVRNVSQLVLPDTAESERKFNPTIIALPPWAANQYLLVSRVVTNGLHQESLICEASICSNPNSTSNRKPDEPACTPDETAILGAAGGLHCKTPPITIDIPPTPAQQCEGSWAPFPDIPGFHDPRIFWSGRGEPLIMVNSASRYACVGLWLVDLRTLHKPLQSLLGGPPNHPSSSPYPGPLMSYPYLTELTRNPASTRAAVEKNWFLFYPTPEQAFLHYDLSLPRHDPHTNETIGGRAFAKLIGNGFTTPNLTDPSERSCLHNDEDAGSTSVSSNSSHSAAGGTWHQTSNALKLILCHRRDAEHGTCDPSDPARAVHFAVMHRKFSNEWRLPLRYERFLVVWDSRPPFRVLAGSRYPVLMANETASGWGEGENWADENEDEEGEGEGEETFADRNVEGVWFEKNSSILHNLSSLTVRSHPVHPLNPPPLAHNSSSNHPPTSPAIHLPSDHTNTTHRKASSRTPKKPNWAYFTYTTSIAWAWRPAAAYDHSHDPDQRASHQNYQRTNHKRDEQQIPSFEQQDADKSTDTDTDSNTNPGPEAGGDRDNEENSPNPQNTKRILEGLSVGYLDDDVVLGIGVDDQGQVFAKLSAAEVLGCLRMCPT